MTSHAREDLLFGDLVMSYVSVLRFQWRDWLTQDLPKRLAERTTRPVLLTAQPYAEKSTFTAHIAPNHPDWPREFADIKQTGPMGAAVQ